MLSLTSSDTQRRIRPQKISKSTDRGKRAYRIHLTRSGLLELFFCSVSCQTPVGELATFRKLYYIT